MEPTLPNQSSDAVDIKPSFRKPINDVSGRRYRRHSPDADSSSSDEYSKHRQGHHQRTYKEDNAKDYKRKRNDGRGSHRDHYDRSERGSRRYMNYDREDRYNYTSTHGQHGRERRDVDGEDNNHHMSSRSSRESRDAANLHHGRQEEKSRGHLPRDKYDSSFRSNNIKTITRNQHKDKDIFDGKRESHSSPGKNKNDDRFTRDLNITKDFSSKSCRTGNKESDRQENILNQRRLGKDYELDRNKNDSASDDEAQNKRCPHSQWAKDVRNNAEKKADTNKDISNPMKKHKSGDQEHKYDSIGVKMSHHKLKDVADDGKLHSSAKQVETNSKFTTAPINPMDQTGSGVDLGAAKVAALKAAELVNKNIGSGGVLTTDQKKKLLWGNKKSTATEESGSRWEVPLFADKERQEKFNKLMGVKGEKIEPKAVDKDGSLQAEKQEQMQMDLEKQYTAGLRRRDGRTVGLGL